MVYRFAVMIMTNAEDFQYLLIFTPIFKMFADIHSSVAIQASIIYIQMILLCTVTGLQFQHTSHFVENS